MIRCLLLAILTLMPGRTCAAVDFALFVGVTDYSPSLSALAPPLDGPGRDVALMYRVMRGLGLASENTVILTDRPQELAGDWDKGTHEPTRKAILNALRELSLRVTPEARVLIYLAGHGSQLPAKNDLTEPDGLDEIFLAKDARYPIDHHETGLVRDDEIGHYIDLMIENGADVWLIVDACHSGTLRRNAEASLTPRFVNLQPESSPIAAPNEFLEPRLPAQTGDGIFVGFYGAQADSLAYETRINGTDAVHGVFTWAIAKALRQRSQGRFADLARRVTSALWHETNGRATPAFTGNLNAQLGGTAVPIDQREYAVTFDDAFVIRAGLLDQAGPAARFKIMTEKDQFVATVNARQVKLDRTIVELEAASIPNLDALLRAEGVDPEKHRQRWLKDRAPKLSARLIQSEARFSLRVAIDTAAMSSALADRVIDAIGELGPIVELDDINPAMHLTLDGDFIVLAPAPVEATASMGVNVNAETFERDLVALLRRVAKAWSLGQISDVLVGAKISREINADVFVTAGVVKPDDTCEAQNNRRKVKSTQAVPKIAHCDVIAVDITNDGDTPLDLTPLYVAPDQQIYFLPGYEGSARGGLRLQPGETRTVTYTEVTKHPEFGALATGRVQLIVLAVTADERKSPMDFRYLQETSPLRDYAGKSSATLTSLLGAAGFGLAYSRSVYDDKASDSGVLVIPLETVSD